MNDKEKEQEYWANESAKAMADNKVCIEMEHQREMKPTNAEIKEFWEKFDCLEIKQFPSTHPLLGSQGVMIDAWVWKPTEQRISHQIGDYSGMPPIDLNNLWEFAVPKAIEKLSKKILPNMDDTTRELEALRILLNSWLEKIKHGFSYEYALFWALRGGDT